MKRIITRCEAVLGPWMMNHLNAGQWFPGRGQIIGLAEDTEVLAACLFEAYNGASIMLHCAASGKKWLNREFLWFVFYYPFKQLNVTKIISPVESDNSESRRFIEHIGFTLEATLKDAAPKGDLLIYSMRKDQCKWLNLKGKYRGQTQGSPAT